MKAYEFLSEKSVQRYPDGQVFSVGDVCLLLDELLNPVKFIIGGFVVKENGETCFQNKDEMQHPIKLHLLDNATVEGNMCGKKAITRVLTDEVVPIKESEEHWDCDFSLFEPMVKQMNKMGCPITMDDLIQITEERLSGKRVEPPREPYLRYTFICNKRIEELKNETI